MKLTFRSRYRPESPLGEGEVNRDNCDCRCEYDHCQDCEGCRRRNQGQCDDCDLGNCSCNECDCDDYCTCEPSQDGLYEYGKDVLRVFSATVDDYAPGDILLGAEVELEIPHGDDFTRGFEKAFKESPFFIGKEDGSLNNGVEMVTLPLTIEQHNLLGLSLEKHWFPIMEKSKTCGMHVHIAKAGFNSETHMEKFASFFGDHNENENWNLFLDRLLRRPANHYCNRLSTAEDFKNNGKYSAVNFSKQYTLEVRGFATTTSHKVYMANIELVKAVRDATVGNLQLPTKIPRNFIAWVLERKEDYPFLATRLQITHKDNGDELFLPWLGEVVENIPVTFGDEECNLFQEENSSNIYGPNTERVRAYIQAISEASEEELSAARDAAWDAAWDATSGATRGATRGAAWDAAWDATRGAIALVIEDLVTEEQFKILVTGYEAFIPGMIPQEELACA